MQHSARRDEMTSDITHHTVVPRSNCILVYGKKVSPARLDGEIVRLWITRSDFEGQPTDRRRP